MEIVKDEISIKLVNNTPYPQNAIVFGTVPNLQSPNQNENLYVFTVTSEDYLSLENISIAISNTSNLIPVTYTLLLLSDDIQGIVNALNTLNMGIFQYVGTTIYVSSPYYIYGALNVNSTVAGFVSTWNTANVSGGSSASNQISLPLVTSGTYNFVVDWGDGNTDTITTWNQAETLHTYASSGTYVVTIQGVIEGWSFGYAVMEDCLKILSVSDWGSLVLDNTSFQFGGCENLDLSSTIGVLDLSASTDLSGIFNQCLSLTTINGINSWDFSTITVMNYMFGSCNLFNQDLNSINVSNVQSMPFMFSGATAFNGNISSWNTSSLTNASSMFSGATSFNQNIGSWDVSNVTSMNGMLQNATAFNQNIASWDVSSVTDLFNFMTGKSSADYSISYLNAIYNTWSTLTLQPTLTADFGTIQYTSSGSAGRAILTGVPNNWTVNDGGIVASSSIFATTGSQPFGIKEDSLGNLFVANNGGSSISKITPLGVSSIFATTGVNPTKLALDSSDNIYVLTSGFLGIINKITPLGVVTTFATINQTLFDIVIDSSNNLFVTSNTSGDVYKITSSGTVTTFNNSTDSANGIVIDSSDNLYVCYSGGGYVNKITPLGVSTFLGTTGTYPIQITLDYLGNVYTANTSSNNVSKITPIGVSTILGSTAGVPYGIDSDSLGNIYVACSSGNVVTKITPAGALSSLSSPTAPQQLMVSDAGNLYVTCFSSDLVRVFAI
jgi:surface protein